MAIAALSGATSEQKHVVTASFLGWSLDAFDFFLLVFVLKDIAEEFQTDISNVTLVILLTLAMRPVGAFIFGRAADRWRPPPDPDGQHPPVFNPRIRLGFCAEPDGADHPARPVWRRDGWRMGRGRIADDGKHSAACPWFRFRAASIGLSHRLFSGVDRLWPPVSIHRMARDVHGRRHPPRLWSFISDATCRNRQAGTGRQLSSGAARWRY
jgi:MFS family permease